MGEDSRQAADADGVTSGLELPFGEVPVQRKWFSPAGSASREQRAMAGAVQLFEAVEIPCQPFSGGLDPGPILPRQPHFSVVAEK